MTSRQIEVARKVAILIGVVYGTGVITGFLGLFANALPHFRASSTSPGSTVLLYLESAVIWLPAAFIGGYLVVRLIESPTPWRWAVALAVLNGYMQLVSWSFGWRWIQMDWETRLGVVLASALIGLTSLWGSRLSLGRRKLEGVTAA
jgi:hypothetical protein